MPFVSKVSDFKSTGFNKSFISLLSVSKTGVPNTGSGIESPRSEARPIGP
jgi:hypothetical protein